MNKGRTSFFSRNISVRLYRGFGHQNKMQVFGHVVFARDESRRTWRRLMGNLKELIRLFFVKPLAGVEITMEWGEKKLVSKTEKDGFFRFEWDSEHSVPAGEHPIKAVVVHNGKQFSAEGSIIVPHATQMGVISDIDDTLLISHSSTIIKRLVTLIRRQASSRKAFDGVADFYRKLQYANTAPDEPNPFFYVSSSEWNLYTYLQVFFDIHRFPRGVFLLNQIKRWYELLKSGQTKHSGKFVRIVRIMEAFPKQRFVLIGDNSQQDPEIYAAVAEYFPQRIKAVYIRKVVKSNMSRTERHLKVLKELNIPCHLFRKSKDAAAHAKGIGLI